jgi:hypothetical protein
MGFALFMGFIAAARLVYGLRPVYKVYGRLRGWFMGFALFMGFIAAARLK